MLKDTREKKEIGPINLYHPRVLIVDDDLNDVTRLYHLVVNLGFDVNLSFSGREALQLTNRQNYDFIILDWKMPEISGQEFLLQYSSKTRKHRRPLNVILHSGVDLSDTNLSHSSAIRILDIWQKPMDIRHIMERLADLGAA